MVAIAMPPGKCPTQALAARNNSRLIPDTLTSDPIRMNIGMTLKLKLVTVRIGESIRMPSAGPKPDQIGEARHRHRAEADGDRHADQHQHEDCDAADDGDERSVPSCAASLLPF